MSREIETIRVALRAIADSLRRLAPAIAPRDAAPSAAGKARQLRLSPARRAALKLQGQYIGHIRTLAPRDKARAQAIRKAKGVRAAIVFARQRRSR